MTGVDPDAAWLRGGRAEGAKFWLDNAGGAVHELAVGGHRIPLVLADDTAATSYVSSPLSAWVRYPLAEAGKCLSPAQRAAARLAARPLTALLQACGLDRPAMLGNWLVSTNLHPAADDSAWQSCFAAAISLAGERPLVMRSVCPDVNRALSEQLVAAGWLLIPARLVYLCDPSRPEVWKHNHVRKDRRLLAGADLSLGGPESIGRHELPGLRTLFRQLFVDKYSPLNPDFSAAFFALCRDQRFLDLYVLRQDGIAVGVLGLLERHGWVTTPLIGYDTGRPQELGLYRRLMALLLAESDRRGARLHYSSGAGSFKRARGAQPAIEYTAVYARHLPATRRAAMGAFCGLMKRLGVPVLWRYG